MFLYIFSSQIYTMRRYPFLVIILFLFFVILVLFVATRPSPKISRPCTIVEQLPTIRGNIMAMSYY